MEELTMQPGANPDDLHTVLSRYHTWAEKQPGQPVNGNGHKNGAAAEGVRELTYEEALERHGVGQGGARARRKRAASAEKPTGAVQAVTEAGTQTAQDDVQAGVRTETEARPRAESRTEARADTRARREWIEAMEFPGRGEAEIIEASVSGQEELAFRGEESGAERNPVRVSGAATRNRSAERVASAAGKGAAVIENRTGDAKTEMRVAKRKPATRAAGPGTAKQTEFRQVLARTVSSAGKAAKEEAAQAKERVAPLRRQARELKVERAMKPGTQINRKAAKKKTALVKKEAVAARKKAEPERTRRITTRFSKAEERRIEKAAAVAGMSVSAWLRQCALGAGSNTGGSVRAQALAARTGHEARETTRVVAARAPVARARRSGAAKAGVVAPAPLFAQTANASLVGGWLTLLRQRFLGSPARFAEQA